MATDAQKLELRTKISELVARYYKDYVSAFGHYANERGTIAAEELHDLLDDAGVGDRFTRQAWVRGILEELDTDQDGEISAAEFEAALK